MGSIRARLMVCSAIAGGLLIGLPVRSAEPRTFPVVLTYNQRPFSYQIELVEEAEAHRRYRVQFPSPVVTPVVANNTVPCEYFLPRVAEPATLRRPAVVCLHILNGNFELERITCSTLAARGIPALLVKLPYYGERASADARRRMLRDPQLLATALGQGIEDVRRAVDLLASRDEVNPRAVGAIGISMGGIVAATAAAREPRLARTALVLAGGDLGQVIAHARETRELRQAIQSLDTAGRAQVQQAIADVDPLSSATRLRPRAQQGRVLMINAAEDEVIPAECTRKLAAALGIADRVHWLAGLGHYTALAALPDVLTEAADFFALDLPAEARVQPVRTHPGPIQELMRLATQAAQVMGPDPAEGHGHLIDLEADVTPSGRKPVAVRLRLVRGWGGRFRVEAQAPQIGQVGLGRCDYPWMLAAGNTVFRGILAAGSTNPSPVDPRHVLKIRVVAGALAAAGMAPQVLESLVRVTDDSTPAERAVRIETKQSHRLAGRLTFKPDGGPARLSVAARDVELEVRFRQWQPNTVVASELFLEPAGVKCQDVDRADLEQMFSAMFNLALDSL